MTNTYRPRIDCHHGDALQLATVPTALPGSHASERILSSHISQLAMEIGVAVLTLGEVLR